MEYPMRAATLLAALLLTALPGGAAAQGQDQSAYDLSFSLQPHAKRTLFLADDAVARSGALPVLRVCYVAPTSTPRAEHMKVHMGERFQMLRPGECSFFSGARIEASVANHDGSLRASALLLR